MEWSFICNRDSIQLKDFHSIQNNNNNNNKEWSINYFLFSIINFFNNFLLHFVH